MITRRETTIPVYDLSLVVFNERSNISSRTKIITLSSSEPFALLVDDVSGTVSSDLVGKEEKPFCGQIFYNGSLVPVIFPDSLWEVISAEREIKAPDICIFGKENLADTSVAFHRETVKEERKLDGTFLVFQIEKEKFGVSAELVSEVLQVENITNVPGLSDYIVGMVSVRGEVVPLIDLKTLFYWEKLEISEKSKIIVIKVEKEKIGILASEIVDIISVYSGDLRLPQHLSSSFGGAVVSQFDLGSDVVSILDLRTLLEKIKLEEGGRHELVKEG
jgi:purine-binding chemotaxis protein CheW